MDNLWTVPGYRHIRELGAGTSGRVFMAEHIESGIGVAIKYLTPELALDPVFVSRFRDEARLLSELEDPHLVQFFEYVETSTRAALVMELVDGVSLAQILADSGPLEPEAALVVLKGSLLGLAAAHASGIVHRDYKPGNVLVDGEGNSLLSDFGIAVRPGGETPAVGTPAYMPPEQWDGAPSVPAADVYAATAVCYECLTGRRPYEGRTLGELAMAHRSRPVPVENVPPGLRDLLSAGMAKDVRGRPQSAFAYLLELEMTAGAAYGPDWEDRGRAFLKARALSLALLFPVTRPSYEPNTEVLNTVLDAPPLPPRSHGYRPSPRLGLLATAAGAVMALVVTGGLLAVNAADKDEVVQQAAPATQSSPTAKTGGEVPTGKPDKKVEPVGDRPSVTVTVTASPTDAPSGPASPSKPASPSGPPPETDSPEPDPSEEEPDEPTEPKPPKPTEEPTDPAEPTEEPTEPVEPTAPPEEPTDPAEPTEEPTEPVEPTAPGTGKPSQTQNTA
ncbi:serine/threonine-protein kinase [Actinocorallia aurantiaca]|uniref:Protein kinase domain-containing protein n=1 Tax=Actinocorallia aurantiaca TaxID=46204 RepID=A0ABN3UD00_9ACTN